MLKVFYNCFERFLINHFESMLSYNTCIYDIYGILTHMWRMNFPIVIIWMSPLSFIVASAVIFHFYFIFSLKSV